MHFKSEFGGLSHLNHNKVKFGNENLFQKQSNFFSISETNLNILLSRHLRFN